MKIAVLSGHTPSLFWFRTDMMKEFMSRGHEVIAVGNENESDWKEKFASFGVRYISAEIERNGMNPLSERRTLKSLYGILKEEHPDKIFTYQAKTIVYGSIAAHRCGINDIYPLIAGLGSVFMHDSIKFRLAQAVLSTEYRISLKYADKVFFQNHDDVDYFVGKKMVSPDKIVMLGGSGVNLEKFTQMPLPEKPAFLCISRLIRDKGVIEYLEAARVVKAIHRDVRFMLVGPYDTNPSAIKPEELQPYIDDGVIEYYGEQSDVRPYLGQCSIFVLPSYREGTPKTVLEAMAAGRAVITTDAPGCRETVTDGFDGALVPVRDVGALARKMDELISSPETVTRYAQNGRKTVEDKFDVKKVNAAICSAMGL